MWEGGGGRETERTTEKGVMGVGEDGWGVGGGTQLRSRDELFVNSLFGLTAVSYTHLTLPTSSEV